MLNVVLRFLKLHRLSNLVPITLLLILSSCGGSGSSPSPSTTPVDISFSSASVTTSISSANSSVNDSVILSGDVTYDYVPHNVNHIGLNYGAVEQRPVRGAVVELVDGLDQVKASTKTTENGTYFFTVQKNILIKVRVKAQLLSELSPTWDFSVTDNTANNSLYVLDGSLASAGATDSKRSLHASSGWDGVGYTDSRSAAPFAILDNVYTGLIRLSAAGNTQNLRKLELRWSVKNSVAEGDYTLGEIGTSFYDGTAIYILGDANNDIDEYDPHVLLHEWGHYIEREISRSDGTGGEHSDGEFLDIRVAMSEGFANAFAGMMLDDAEYADASGTGQSTGFTFNLGKKNRSNKGYFSEGSVGSILYNFYASNVNKIENGFTPIFRILSSISYNSNDAFTSIYLFYEQLKLIVPEHSSLFSILMQEQAIYGIDEYGKDESNNGGLSFELPVYKLIEANNSPVNVCSSNQYGEQNKLGNSQFLKLNIVDPKSYEFQITKSGGDPIISKPEYVIYRKGMQMNYISNSMDDSVSGTVELARGIYIIEVYDLQNMDNETNLNNSTCFDVRVTAN